MVVLIYILVIIGRNYLVLCEKRFVKVVVIEREKIENVLLMD